MKNAETNSLPTSQALSAERLTEIAAREKAATSGPWCTDSWEIYQGTEYVPGISEWIGETCRGTTTLEQDRADAAFVAAAREDVPALLADNERLRKSLREATEQIAGLESDLGGATARVAELEALNERYRKATYRAAGLAGLVPRENMPAEADRVVAYRNPDRPDVLLCREHGDGWWGMTPLTSDDLPDGGLCTYGAPQCGRDVLAA